MTYIPAVHDVTDEACTEKATELIPDRNRQKIRDEIADLVELEFDRLESDADYFLTQTAARRAEAFLEKVLEGDDDAAKELLGGKNDRYRDSGYKKGEPWCSLIHGRLFETGGIALRRQIVEANADLIRNERIADLESIVDGLTQQIQKAEREIATLQSRLCG